MYIKLTQSILQAIHDTLESFPHNFSRKIIMSLKTQLVKTLRNGLGLIIVFGDWVSRPGPTKRSPEEQQVAQDATRGLSLYQFYACPFCVKTRRAIHQLNIDIESRDINKKPVYREQLEQGAGKVKVPCLRIEEGGQVRWMYESDDIIRFLKMRVA